MRLSLVLIFALAAPVLAVDVFTHDERTWAYAEVDVQGWTLYMHTDLLAKDDPAKKKAFSALITGLTAQLREIQRVIPADKLSTLRAVKFWASDEPAYPLRTGELGLLTHHRSQVWLDEHGLNPAMAGGIHIINPRHVAITHRVFTKMPMVVLHELTHVYHGTVLTGAQDADIERRYDEAMAEGIYESVPARGGGVGRERAYAASNKREYFAEVTEAYFGTNDYCPRTRDALFLHDPRGLRLVEKMWGVPTPYTPAAGGAAVSPCLPAVAE